MERVGDSGDGSDAGLELCEGAAGAGPEMEEGPAGGTEDAAVLAPEQQGRAMEQQGMAERAKGASFSAERAANQADGEGLILEVGGFIAQDALTNGVEQAGRRGVAKRAIVGHGENFRGHQHDGAGFQAGELAQTAKDAIHPIVGEPGDSLAIQKAPQHCAMALLLGDKKLERRHKRWISGKYRVRGRSSQEPAAARKFPQLKLLNRAGDEEALLRAKQAGIMPGQVVGRGLIPEEVGVPRFEGRGVVGDGRGFGQRHARNIKYFVLQSQAEARDSAAPTALVNCSLPPSPVGLG